jgi:pimeloyl-ACP methyl ester carboxylesterase
MNKQGIEATDRSGSVGNPSANRTFVLVHGGFHGGWCWHQVASRLRAHGHRVFTPTQTGCGERSHLMSASITLDTFVDDIANVLLWEDLSQVVLVGHSFGGNAISGVADRMPERLRQLIYLDAAMLENGQSMFSLLEPQVVAARLAAAQASGGMSISPPPAALFGIQDQALARAVQSRLTPQPLGTYTSPLRLAHPVTNGVAAVYVQCTAPLFAGVQTARDWVRANGMQSVELATGHDAMLTAPDLLSDLLEQLSRQDVPTLSKEC